MPISQQDREAAIDTVIGEAVGEGFDGMLAVAFAIANRAETRGQTLSQVVGSPAQFAGFTNPGSAARAAQNDPNVRATAGRAVDLAASRSVPDPTRGADHFHALSVNPDWAQALPQTTVIGNHAFYQSPQASRALASLAPAHPSHGPVALDPNARAAAQAQAQMGLLGPTPGLTPRSEPQITTVPTITQRGTPLGAAPAQQPSPSTLSLPGLNITHQLDAVAPGRQATRQAEPFAGIVMHHDVSRSLDQLANITRGQQTGYHFAIDPQGRVMQMAPLDVRTNHVRGPNHPSRNAAPHLANWNTIGIALIGPEAVRGQPTPAQQRAVEALTRGLMEQFPTISPQNIVAHGQIQGGRHAAAKQQHEGTRAAEWAQATAIGLAAPAEHPARGPVPLDPQARAEAQRQALGPMPFAGPEPAHFGLPPPQSPPPLAERTLGHVARHGLPDMAMPFALPTTSPAAQPSVQVGMPGPEFGRTARDRTATPTFSPAGIQAIGAIAGGAPGARAHADIPATALAAPPLDRAMLSPEPLGPPQGLTPPGAFVSPHGMGAALSQPSPPPSLGPAMEWGRLAEARHSIPAVETPPGPPQARPDPQELGIIAELFGPRAEEVYQSARPDIASFQEEVKSVQQAFNDLGLDLAVDGILGPQTQQAIEAVERDILGWEPTGQLTPELAATVRSAAQERGHPAFGVAQRAINIAQGMHGNVMGHPFGSLADLPSAPRGPAFPMAGPEARGHVPWGQFAEARHSFRDMPAAPTPRADPFGLPASLPQARGAQPAVQVGAPAPDFGRTAQDRTATPTFSPMGIEALPAIAGGAPGARAHAELPALSPPGSFVGSPAFDFGRTAEARTAPAPTMDPAVGIPLAQTLSSMAPPGSLAPPAPATPSLSMAGFRAGEAQTFSPPSPAGLPMASPAAAPAAPAPLSPPGTFTPAVGQSEAAPRGAQPAVQIGAPAPEFGRTAEARTGVPSSMFDPTTPMGQAHMVGVPDVAFPSLPTVQAQQRDAPQHPSRGPQAKPTDLQAALLATQALPQAQPVQAPVQTPAPQPAPPAQPPAQAPQMPQTPQMQQPPAQPGFLGQLGQAIQGVMPSMQDLQGISRIGTIASGQQFGGPVGTAMQAGWASGTFNPTVAWDVFAMQPGSGFEPAIAQMSLSSAIASGMSPTPAVGVPSLGGIGDAIGGLFGGLGGGLGFGGEAVGGMGSGNLGGGFSAPASTMGDPFG